MEEWDDWQAKDAEYCTVYFKRNGKIDADLISVRGGQAVYQDYLLNRGEAVRRLEDEESMTLSDFTG